MQKLYALGLTKEEIERLPYSDPEQLRIYRVCSPISGKVVNRHITPGEYIAQNQEIYTIADLDRVWAEVSLFSKEREVVKEGQKLILTAHRDSSSGQDLLRSEGNVIYLSPLLNEETFRAEAIAEIDNQEGTWIPGSFALAEIVTGEELAALLVPRTAIHQINSLDTAFVFQGEGFAVRPVVLGRSDEQFIEILSGIEPGEDAATENSYLLKAELQKTEAQSDD